MIRGINKQIIEIKCTNDEYFEKALLFVRAEKCTEPYELIESCARDYCSSLTPQKRGKNKTALILMILLLAVSAGAVMCLFIF